MADRSGNDRGGIHDRHVRLPARADRGGSARLDALRNSNVHLRALAAAATCSTYCTHTARGCVLDEFAQRYRTAPSGRTCGRRARPGRVDGRCLRRGGSGERNSGCSDDPYRFAIAVSDSSLPAGANKLAINNAGATLHELEVFTLPAGVDAANFPVSNNVADTDSVGMTVVDEVEDIAPGTGTSLNVTFSRANTCSSATCPLTTTWVCTRWSRSSRRSIQRSRAGRQRPAFDPRESNDSVLNRLP